MRSEEEIMEAIHSLPMFDPFKSTGNSEFDYEAARDWVYLWETTATHIEGSLAGQPYILQQHELGIAANYFGWIRDVGKPNERRRFSEIFYLVAQGNSKTTFLACWVLVILAYDKVPNAQILGTATSAEQAGLLQRILVAMIHNQPGLEQAMQIYQTRIIHGSKVFIRLSAKDSTAHGFNPYFSVNDEVHGHLKPAFLEVVKAKSLKRYDSTIVYISTSDWQRDGSICNILHDRARQILRGQIDAPYFLPAVFELTPEMLAEDPDCWKDEKNWIVPNPLLGKALSWDKFRQAFKEAIESPALLNEWQRLCMNMRTENQAQLLKMENWVEKCGGPLDISQYEGKQAVGAGLDLGNTSDLNSLCLIFERPGDGDKEYDAFWWHWTPREKAEERQRQDQGANYTTWADAGWMKLTDGAETDYSLIAHDIGKIGERFGIPTLAVDRLFQGAEMCQNLSNNYGFNIVEFGQGFLSMSMPTKYFVDLTNKGHLHHGDNSLMRWQAGNLQGKIDSAGNIKPDKAKSGNKIDGIVSCIMALGVAMDREPVSENPYETRGILMV